MGGGREWEGGEGGRVGWEEEGDGCVGWGVWGWRGAKSYISFFCHIIHTCRYGGQRASAVMKHCLLILRGACPVLSLSKCSGRLAVQRHIQISPKWEIFTPE